MRILRVRFNDVLIFKDNFDINFTATDRVMEDDSIFKIWGPINTQQSISIIGINAVGKTTSVKLIQLAMEIVLNNKGLNDEDLIPSVFLNDKTKTDGILMEVYFYKDDQVFKLESIIKYRMNEDGNIFFYYEDETLKVKSKSNVTSKKNIFDFNKAVIKNLEKRSQLDEGILGVLKDDDSIAILATKGSKTTVNTMFDGVTERTESVYGDIEKKILNVFDSNLKTLKKLDGDKSVTIEFENSSAGYRLPSKELEGIISLGTLKGQNIIRKAMIALKNGGYLIIDELENHLNKELVKMIINIFNNDNINRKGACLIFTTHYSEILDSFDRKDNIYVLIRDKHNFTNIQNYSDVVKRNELKKSEVILSNYIKGTAPSALSIRELEEYICQNI